MHFAPGLVKPRKIPMGSFFKFVLVPLNGILFAVSAATHSLVSSMPFHDSVVDFVCAGFNNQHGTKLQISHSLSPHLLIMEGQ